MTPTQLRSFATVVRTGSVRAAAEELQVSEAAVSGNVGALRKEFDDRLFSPSRNGLVFTPGGLRLAQRAIEMLGLQEQTKREVDSARGGRRLLRIAATSMFAEYGAPGLIELFSKRADDLEVELMVQPSTRFDELLISHGADVAVGPKASGPTPSGLVAEEFLRYDSSVQLTGRDALEDAEIAGVDLPRGRAVLALLAAANRDPEAFDRPDELDITRERIKPVSFGGGIHLCLGAQLARIEAHEALNVLLERLPNLELDDVDKPDWKQTITLRGVRTLPATW